ncbi:3-oxoacyl-ACP synthase III family protein [Phytohabitans aurantiacus]|uniref:3-oxoacyl-ACP synthase n=1 Tax=Phytohabitans aurantiacus TaxID=3016789 RepID=A0ABQ5QXJ8_9ACTN|nr:ketoacyl-ACP synthase III family protein [Phytohabitans aurantiacus]GLH99268.1 3-oxoacyl-ACP synthase [Phytohabitans aurantiacus]
MLYLQAVAPFVPGDTIGIADPDARLGIADTEVRRLTRFLGLDRVPTAGRRTVLDMLVAAGQDALAGVDRSRVRYAVHAHTAPHAAPPDTRLMDALRQRLGLPGARAFAMSHQACAIGLYAMTVLESLLRAEPPGSLALLMVADKVVSGLMRHLPGITVTGDAAAAVLVGLDGPGDAVLGVARRTLGEFHEAGNMPEPLRRRYHQLYVPTVAAVIRDALDTAGVAMDAVSLVLPHNVNRYSWSVIARHLGLDLDRVYLANVPRMGHCHCADPYVNLVTARAEAALAPGDIVLMVSVGQGGTFCAAVLRTAAQAPLPSTREVRA